MQSAQKVCIVQESITKVKSQNGTSVHYREVTYTHECIEQKMEYIQNFFPELFDGDDANDPTPTVHENEEKEHARH